MERALGVSSDGGLDLVGAVALDHRGRVGLVLGRAEIERQNVWVGVLCAPFGDPRGGGYRQWTSRSPLVVATSLREYAEATDDQLGLDGVPVK